MAAIADTDCKRCFQDSGAAASVGPDLMAFSMRCRSNRDILSLLSASEHCIGFRNWQCTTPGWFIWWPGGYSS